MVPRPGLEPGCLAALVFETSASTYSAIWANVRTKVQGNFGIAKKYGGILLMSAKIYGEILLMSAKIYGEILLMNTKIYGEILQKNELLFVFLPKANYQSRIL